MFGKGSQQAWSEETERRNIEQGQSIQLIGFYLLIIMNAQTIVSRICEFKM